MYLKSLNVHGFIGNDKNRKYLKFEQYRIRFFGGIDMEAYTDLQLFSCYCEVYKN